MGRFNLVKVTSLVVQQDMDLYHLTLESGLLVNHFRRHSLNVSVRRVDESMHV